MKSFGGFLVLKLKTTTALELCLPSVNFFHSKFQRNIVGIMRVTESVTASPGGDRVNLIKLL